MCREYARARGYELVAELAEDDRGASGAAFELPQLNHVLDVARAGAFDVLVVRELDRLSRSLAKQLIVEEELRRSGVQIEYVLGEYPDTPEGNLMKNVRAVISEYERLKIGERMERGRRLVVESGAVLLHGDQPPYGYRVSEDGKTLVVHDPEARIVRLIFTWYAEGDESGRKIGSKAIARRLTEMGLPTWKDIHKRGYKKRGYGEWSDGTITGILSNETYIGHWHYGKRRSGMKRNPRSQWLRVEVPAIISHELWDMGEEQKQRNKAMARRNRKYDYLMSGHMTCGRCGHRMYGRSTRGGKNDRFYYLYYYCAAKGGHIVGQHCDMPAFSGGQVDTSVWVCIKSFLTDPTALAEGLKGQQTERQRDNAPLRERLVVVDDSLADNRRQVQRLLDLYLTGDFPKEMLRERKAGLEETIAALGRERVGLIAQLEAQTLTKVQMQTIEQFARQVAEGLEIAEGDFQMRRRVIEALDVSAMLALEDGEKIVYVQCLLGDEKSLIVNGTTCRRSPRMLAASPVPPRSAAHPHRRGLGSAPSVREPAH